MRIVYMGTGEIGLPALRDLIERPEHELAAVFTQPDRPVGRKQIVTPPEVKKLAQAHAVPVFQPEKIRDPEPVQALLKSAPEVIVVFAYGQILPAAVLEAPSIACINLHASLLPAYRGAAPIQASIRAGDAETGITVIYMEKGLDTGDILLAETIAIAPEETGGTLHDRIAELAPATLRRALELLAAAKAPRVAQDHEAATQSPRLYREDGRIRWCEDAESIERTIRAYDPWPGTFTRWKPDGGRAQNLKIFPPVRVADGGGGSGEEPGTVLSAGEEGILVAAGGGGALCCKDLQAEGRRRMGAAEFLRGATIRPGERFDS